jgi:hypothetical protein
MPRNPPHAQPRRRSVIGCGIGILYRIVTMTLAGAPVTVVTVLLGIGTGLLPGAIMGLHVSLDR